MREGKPILPLRLRGEGFPLLITTHYADVTDGRMPPQEFYAVLSDLLPTPEVPEKTKIIQVKDLPSAITIGDIELILIPPGEFYQGDATGFTATYTLFEIPHFGGG